MSDIRDELKELSKELSTAKTEASKTEGQIIALETQLKDEYNISDIKDIVKEIETLRKTYDQLKEKAERYLKQARDIIDDTKGN